MQDVSSHKGNGKKNGARASQNSVVPRMVSIPKKGESPRSHSPHDADKNVLILGASVGSAEFEPAKVKALCQSILSEKYKIVVVVRGCSLQRHNAAYDFIFNIIKDGKLPNTEEKISAFNRTLKEKLEEFESEDNRAKRKIEYKKKGDEWSQETKAAFDELSSHGIKVIEIEWDDILAGKYGDFSQSDEVVHKEYAKENGVYNCVNGAADAMLDIRKDGKKRFPKDTGRAEVYRLACVNAHIKRQLDQNNRNYFIEELAAFRILVSYLIQTYKMGIHYGYPTRNNDACKFFLDALDKLLLQMSLRAEHFNFDYTNEEAVQGKKEQYLAEQRRLQEAAEAEQKRLEEEAAKAKSNQEYETLIDKKIKHLEFVLRGAEQEPDTAVELIQAWTKELKTLRAARKAELEQQQAASSSPTLKSMVETIAGTGIFATKTPPVDVPRKSSQPDEPKGENKTSKGSSASSTKGSPAGTPPNVEGDVSKMFHGVKDSLVKMQGDRVLADTEDSRDADTKDEQKDEQEEVVNASPRPPRSMFLSAGSASD